MRPLGRPAGGIGDGLPLVKPERGEDAALPAAFATPATPPRAAPGGRSGQPLASSHDGAELRRHALGPGRDQPPAQRNQLGAALRPAAISTPFSAPQRGHRVRGGDVPVGSIQSQRIADAHPVPFALDGCFFGGDVAAAHGEIKTCLHSCVVTHLCIFLNSSLKK